MAICKLNFDNSFLLIILTSIVSAINFRSSFNNVNFYMDAGNYLSLTFDPFLILIKNIITTLFFIAYLIEIKLNKSQDFYKRKNTIGKEKIEEAFISEKTIKDEEDLGTIESIVLSNRLYEKKDKFCFLIKVILSMIFIYIFEEIEEIVINNHILDRLICPFRVLLSLLGILVLSTILFHSKMHKDQIKNFFIFKKHQIIPFSIICFLSICIIFLHAFGIQRFRILYHINLLYYSICCLILGLEFTLSKYLLEAYISKFLILGCKGLLGTIVFTIINIKFNKEEFFNFCDKILAFQFTFNPEDFHIILKIIYVSTLVIFQYLKMFTIEKFGEMHFITSIMITDIIYFPLYCIERFAIQHFDISTKLTFIFDTIVQIINAMLMLVFNEILELNFWGLNTNLRKNIIIREKIDKENLIELYDVNNEDNNLDDDE